MKKHITLTAAAVALLASMTIFADDKPAANAESSVKKELEAKNCCCCCKLLKALCEQKMKNCPKKAVRIMKTTAPKDRDQNPGNDDVQVTESEMVIYAVPVFAPDPAQAQTPAPATDAKK